MNIIFKKLAEKMSQEYTFLYNHRDKVAGYNEAVQAFDYAVTKKNFKQFVGDFVKFRGDFISSDREAAAFMFACESLGFLDMLGV